MIYGTILYRKTNGNEVIYSKSENDEMLGFIRTKDGYEYPEQTIGSIIARGYWEPVYQIIQKHEGGGHDQSSHGNWAKAGVGYQATDKHPKYDFNSEDGVNVEHYTSEGYEEINSFLRTGKVDEEAFYQKDDLREFVRSMDKEINRTSAPRDMVLFRGTSGVSQFENLKEGDVFVDKAFVSTTTDLDTVNQFMSTALGDSFDSRPFQKGYVLEISVPKGSKVLSVNKYFEDVSGRYGPTEGIREENEHILPRGTKFRVDSVGTIDVRGGVEDKLIRVSVVEDEK